jgi:Glyceraldehyde 3-phosphate dehydrogenase, NAD binding domain
MPNKVAINGLGRIGWAALKLAVEEDQLELVAVNEIGSLDNMVYLLKAGPAGASGRPPGRQRHDGRRATGVTDKPRRMTASPPSQPYTRRPGLPSCSRCSSSARPWSSRACSACPRALAAHSG